MKARGGRGYRAEELPEDVVEIVFGQFAPLRVSLRLAQVRSERCREGVVEIVFGQFAPLRLSLREGEDVVRSGRGRMEELPEPDDLLVAENILALVPVAATAEELSEDVMELMSGPRPGLGELPWELLENIFARLPIVYLARMRSVCRGLNRFLLSHEVARPEKPKPWLLLYRTVPRHKIHSLAACTRRDYKLMFKRMMFRAFDPDSSRWYKMWLPTTGGSKVELNNGAGSNSGLVLLRERPVGASTWHYWVGNPLRGGRWQKVAFPKPHETDPQNAHELIVDDVTKGFKILHFRFDPVNQPATDRMHCTAHIYDSDERRWRQGGTSVLCELKYDLRLADCMTSKGVVYFGCKADKGDYSRSKFIVSYVVVEDRFEGFAILLRRMDWPWLLVDDTVECRQTTPAVLQFCDGYEWSFQIPLKRRFLVFRRPPDDWWWTSHESELSPPAPKPEVVLDLKLDQIAGNLDMCYVARICVPRQLCIWMYKPDVSKWEQLYERTYSEDKLYEPLEFSIATFSPRFDV